MHFYFSGAIKSEIIEREIISRNGHRLFSFVNKESIKKYLKIAEGKHVNIMLDSGAFSAWNAGKVIRRDELLRFALSLADKDISLVMINLDKIPGEKGKDPTPDEINEAMDVSQINYEFFKERLPFPVLPVFHQGEPYSYLHTMRGIDYVCLSPRNDVHEAARWKWAQQARRELGNEKTHGLATTGMKMMTAIDWYSVDSATWVHVAAFGQIIINSPTRFYKIPVSTEHKNTVERRDHIQHLSISDEVRSMIESRGFSVENLGTSVQARSHWNVLSFIEYYEDMHEQPPHNQQGLF